MPLLFRVIFLFTFTSPMLLRGQEAIVNISFDDETSYFVKKTAEKRSGSIFSAQSRQFAKGLSGRCLDLSENAALRMPIELLEGHEPGYGEGKALSAEIWVRTPTGALVNSPLGGNKKDLDSKSAGWLMAGSKNGSWKLTISDGKDQYSYAPTAGRQPINDGRWHQLGFVFDPVRGDLRMYYDGKNVAIYNIGRMGSLKSKLSTVFGGTRAKWDYFGQGEAFNGYLDEIRIWEQPLKTDHFENSFSSYFPRRAYQAPEMEEQLKIMAWNIWGGGRQFGKEVGLQRVIETIKRSQADIVGIIETYGSGAIIADSLGYYYYLISSNLSILSRYPITETIKAFKPFNFGGVKLQVAADKQMIYFNTWLHYLPDFTSNLREGKMTDKELAKDEENTRLAEIRQILKEIAPYLADAEQIPVVMGGDFNTNSHLDWTKRTSDIHLGYVVKWPVTLAMENAGFSDTFREVYADPLVTPGYSYWPYSRKIDNERYFKSRIDYIFTRSSRLHTISAEIVDYHSVMWPSDHAAAIAVLKWTE